MKNYFNFSSGLILTALFLQGATVDAAIKAEAKILPTEGNQVTGVVHFESTDKGVRIVADLENLTPGAHGFHIHEKGDCSSHDGSSAGGHFNPTGKKHGGPDSLERHVGDLGNIEADSSGKAHYERVDSLIQLSGDVSVIGRSIVVHQDPDDLKTDPSGNSGKRIGCGLIQEVK